MAFEFLEDFHSVLTNLLKLSESEMVLDKLITCYLNKVILLSGTYTLYVLASEVLNSI